MKIIVFADENLTLTGGNLYDTLLYKTMKQNSNYTIEFCKPIVHKSGFALKKLITPFLEFRYLKKMLNNDIFFWNSVDAYHCLLVVFCLKYFFPKKKVFIIHHHYKFVEMEGLKKVFFKFFELNFLRMASSVIIPSPYILEQTKKFLPSNRINYLELGFADNDIAERNPVKNGQMVFVGNIEHRKGIHLLIESLHLLQSQGIDVQINILGSVIEMDYYESLLQKIKEYGLEQNILFHGRVTDEEKSYFMRTSDIFVFPSLLEGYGMAIIEAMSFGLPVIAFSNSAMPYTIKDGYNGLLALNGDIQDLAQKMEILTRDCSLKEKLRMGALETFSKCRKLPTLIEEMKEFTKELSS